VARSLIARNTDQGTLRRRQTAATAAVSMSRATTPSRRSSSRTSGSVISESDVHRVPAGTSGPRGSGRYSSPLAPSTTSAGRTTVPMGVSPSTAPAMPTTTTRSTGVLSRSRSTPAVARAVPMPVTTATTWRAPSRPVQASVGPSVDRRSDRARVSGVNSMGMATTKATTGGMGGRSGPAQAGVRDGFPDETKLRVNRAVATSRSPSP
jgi:hypothetical protein